MGENSQRKPILNISSLAIKKVEIVPWKYQEAKRAQKYFFTNTVTLYLICVLLKNLKRAFVTDAEDFSFNYTREIMFFTAVAGDRNENNLAEKMAALI